MVQFLPVAGSWRCKEGIYQRRPVRWWRWVFTASFLHAWSPHQSDGGSEGEIFIPPAHCKITYLGPMSPPPPVHFCPFSPATLAPPWPLCSASTLSQPPLANPLPYDEQTPTAFLMTWGRCNHLSSIFRDLLHFLSPAQSCGRCLVWVLNMFHLSHDDGVLKCCNLC